MTMAETWNTCIQAVSECFDVSRTKAKLIVLCVLIPMGLLVLRTWFIWVGFIAVVVGVVVAALIVEWSLRIWYWACDVRLRQASATSPDYSGGTAPERPATALPPQKP